MRFNGENLYLMTGLKGLVLHSVANVVVGEVLHLTLPLADLVFSPGIAALAVNPAVSCIATDII
jgi:hypothetical protein